MMGHDPEHPAGDWEREINELLEGALDETSSEALKAAAARDSELARAILRAWQLQKSMDELQLEKAPVRLRRKLKRIPRDYAGDSRRPWFVTPRWVVAGGMAALLLVAVVLTTGRFTGIHPQQTASQAAADAAKMEQTRRDLATAFYYLDKVGLRVGREIHEELNDELSDPIRDNLSKHLPYTGRKQKEKHV